MKTKIIAGLGLVLVAAIALAATFTDDFNRANSGANAGFGSNWSHYVGGSSSLTGSQILSNQAVVTASFTLRTAMWNGGASANDQFSQATMVTGTADFGEGVTVRMTDGNNFYSCYRLDGSTVRLIEMVAGTPTTLDTQAGALADGGVLRLEVSGTNLTCKVDGVTVIGPFSDSTFSSGSPGLRATNSVTWDDWSGGDLSGGGGSTQPPRTMHQFRMRRPH